jgi:proline iminopeptidase
LAFDQLAGSLPGRAEVQEIIDNLAVPTLVVVGKHDYAVPYVIWESLVANNPAVSYVLMEQDSHNPQTESPDRFDQILLDWLDL